MLHRRCDFSRASWAAVVVLAACEGLVAQPTLLPPGPPFAPSGRMGTRTEITAIPYVITLPGSYYLSSTLTQAVPGNGITVDASNVTIDLMGHSLIGAGFVGDSGITFGPGLYSNVTVHDGFVVGWGATGVQLLFGGGPAPNIHVYNMTVTGCTGDGIAVGPQSIVRHVICSSNTLVGLRADRGVKITNAVCAANLADGIVVATEGHVSDSVVIGNGAAGMDLGFSCTVIASVAAENGGDGFLMGPNGRATDCTAAFNGFLGAGFFGPGNGFVCFENCILGGCAAFNNADSGFMGFPIPPPGPGAPGGNTAHDCTAQFNGFATLVGDGFTEFRAVNHCTAQSNAEHGIQCGFGALVVRNTCESNLFDGIAAMGDGNTIQQNHAAYNGMIGIDTVFNPGPPGNLISSNTGHLNAVADFAFSPFCSFGPIIFAVPGPLPIAAMIGNVSYP